MPRTKPTTLPIGSVSSGTMREADLIPSFVSILEDLRLTREERSMLAEIRRNADVDADDDYWTSETAAGDLEALFDIARDHCPDYTYFGAHEGDGADFGCWVDHDAITEDMRQTTIAPSRQAAGDKNSQYYRATYAYEVNDHGNATLFVGTNFRWREVWSVV